MEKPSVSIIVPIYNVKAFVEDCIQSVMRQTFTGNMECIVVDDCGQDDSMVIVEKMVADYQGPISFKILRHTHNRGLSAARNTGMDAARGEYFFFLDSDDSLTEDCIDNLVKPLANEKIDVVVGFVNYLLATTTGQVVKTHGPQDLNITEDFMLRPPMILRSYKKQWAVVAWNRLYRADFLRHFRLRFKEGLHFEDNLWSFQVACLASSLYIVSKTTYVHKLRVGSIMDTDIRKRHVENWQVIIREMRAFVDAHHFNTIDLFPSFNSAFRFILGYYSESKQEFIAVYYQLRYCVKATLCSIFNSNHNSLGVLHDLHYLLPKSVASRWLFFYKTSLQTAFLKMRSAYLTLFPKPFISLKWKRIMGSSINWRKPRDINEKIQWLLLNSDISAWTRLTDKLKVREFVEEKGLGHLLVPIYGVWKDARQIDFNALPEKFVLKCNHDCGSTLVVDRTIRDFNRDMICKRLNDCLNRNYGDDGELHYRRISPLIFAEEYLELTETEKSLSSSHVDYKVWCFDGSPYCICCYYDRTSRSLLGDVYDLEWIYRPEVSISDGHVFPGFGKVPRPKSLPEMLAAAATLSKGFPQVRVDFYDLDGRLYFGEMTFTSAGGMMRYFTSEFLRELGDQIRV